MIGDDVSIGPQCQLLMALHPMLDHEAHPGVTIEDDTVVGAGSVVTRDLPSRVFAAGNPARVLREL